MVKELKGKKKNMYLNNTTNNFVQNCLKVTHVNSLGRITVRRIFYLIIHRNKRQQGVVKKREQIGNFALSLTNNAALNTIVVMSLMFLMVKISSPWNIQYFKFFLKKCRI